MFYQAFAGVPEWAPPHENHILYSEGILRNVKYDSGRIEYTASAGNGTEFLRTAFKPEQISIDGVVISDGENCPAGYFMLKDLGQGDYSLTVKHKKAGTVMISAIPDANMKMQ